MQPYAERLAPLDFARGKLSDAEGSQGATPMPHAPTSETILNTAPKVAQITQK
jgi:hypothetical protein